MAPLATDTLPHSIALPCHRSDRSDRYRLVHGDVVVWGEPSRLRFHGVLPVEDGTHALVGRRRLNVTFQEMGR